MGTEHTLKGKVRQNAVIQAIAMPVRDVTRWSYTIP
jgi:hypothetical protein